MEYDKRKKKKKISVCSRKGKKRKKERIYFVLMCYVVLTTSVYIIALSHHVRFVIDSLYITDNQHSDYPFDDNNFFKQNILNNISFYKRNYIL